MTHIEFDEQIALTLIQSNDQFPVDFDAAWQWLEYSRKDNAKTNFQTCNFISDLDFRLLKVKETRPDGSFSHYREDINLTVDCFKQWAMMVGTEKGKQVRLYFLECERKLKEQQEFNLPKTYLEALKCLVASEEEKLVLQSSLKSADEAIAGYRNVFTGESTLSMKQASDALSLKTLGRNNLIKYLRTKGMLTKTGSAPTKVALDRGYLIAETTQWNCNDGNTYTKQTGQFTWKGFCWLVKELKADKYPIRTTPQAMWDNYYPSNNLLYLPTAQ